MRRVISVLVVVGLALAVVLLWANRGGDPTPGTDAQATSTTSQPTTTTVPAETTTPADTTTSSPTEVEVVETVEQAEAILATHYFIWFDGIYREDLDRIRQIVILDSQVEAAEAQFGQMEFTAQPKVDAIQFLGTELLRSDSECLAIWSEISAGFRPGSSSGVVIFRWVDSQWKFLSSWQSPDDLWEEDCESSLES